MSDDHPMTFAFPFEHSEQEGAERTRFVLAALSYVGTPYHNNGRVKGAGVDCATLLACAAEDAELLPKVDLPPYSPQWHLHRSAQLYLGVLERYCKEIEPPPRPGDIVLWQFARAFSHGAIVIEWPRIVHACINDHVRIDDSSNCTWLQTIGEAGPLLGKPRPVKYLSFWKR